MQHIICVVDFFYRSNYLGYINGTYGTALHCISITNDHHYVPFIVIASQLHSSSMTYYAFVTRVAQRITLEELHTATSPEHMSSSLVLSGIGLAGYLVFYAMFCISLFVLLSFSFGNCAVCPPIYGC